MTLFYVEYVLATIISFFDGKRNRKIVLILFSIFVFLFAFRDLTATQSDVTEYRLFYDNLDNPKVIAREKFEPAYHLINLIFNLAHLPFEIFMISLGLFYAIMFWKVFSKYSDKPGLVLVSALYYMFWFAGAFRHSIAQILAFWAFYYLLKDEEASNLKVRLLGNRSAMLKFRNKNIAIYYLLSIIAFCFHRTAIILFIVPFFLKRRWKIAITIGAFLLGIILTYMENILSRIPYVYEKYMFYKIGGDYFSETQGGVLSIRLLEYIVIIAILLLIKNKSSMEYLSLSLAELGVIVQVFLGNYMSASYRMLLYTDICILLFIISICKRHKTATFRYGMVMAMSAYTLMRFYRVFATIDDVNLHYGLLGLSNILQ